MIHFAGLCALRGDLNELFPAHCWGPLFSEAHDLFRDATLGPLLFSPCRATAARSAAGFICDKKCHLAQAENTPSERKEREEKGGRGEGDYPCVGIAVIC